MLTRKLKEQEEYEESQEFLKKKIRAFAQTIEELRNYVKNLKAQLTAKNLQIE